MFSSFMFVVCFCDLFIFFIEQAKVSHLVLELPLRPAFRRRSLVRPAALPHVPLSPAAMLSLKQTHLLPPHRPLLRPSRTMTLAGDPKSRSHSSTCSTALVPRPKSSHLRDSAAVPSVALVAVAVAVVPVQALAPLQQHLQGRSARVALRRERRLRRRHTTTLKHPQNRIRMTTRTS